MITYERLKQEEFSSIVDHEGEVYHLKGNYLLNDGEGNIYLPVNRSYKPEIIGQSVSTNAQAKYMKDRMLHEEINDDISLRGREKVIKIIGKKLLFIEAVDLEELDIFSPVAKLNSLVSTASEVVCNNINIFLDENNLDGNIGVMGSHQTGLNGPESDLDLIMWVPRNQRKEAINIIGTYFHENGYTNPNISNRILEYSQRIASLGKLSLASGRYLADQRLRWISPEGIKTSVQCLHKDYDFTSTKKIIDLLINGYFSNSSVIVNNVEVLDTSDPYNFPRRWDLRIDNEIIHAIGFDWVHQGMGTGASEREKYYTLRGSHLVDINNNHFFALINPGDYILPEYIAAI